MYVSKWLALKRYICSVTLLRNGWFAKSEVCRRGGHGMWAEGSSLGMLCCPGQFLPTQVRRLEGRFLSVTVS